MKDLRNIIGSHLNDGHILVDVTENFDSGFVRIIVDSESSLGLDDTTALTRRLIKSKDFNNRYPNGCRVEVTTPGIDFPLIKPYQFRKNINKKIKIRYFKENKICSVQGKISSADDKLLLIKSKNYDVSISYDQIKDSKIILSFS